MDKIVIDASIVVKLFSASKEEHIELAQRLYTEIKENRLNVIAPDFLLIEVTNILLKKKHGHLVEVKEFIRKIYTSGIHFFPFDLRETNRLIRAMNMHHVSAYDGFYVVLAQQERCAIVTSDKQLLSIEKLGFSLPFFYHVN